MTRLDRLYLAAEEARRAFIAEQTEITLRRYLFLTARYRAAVEDAG